MKIHIYTDTESGIVHIVNADTGEELEGVTRAKIEMLPGRPPEAELVLRIINPQLDFDAKLKGLFWETME